MNRNKKLIILLIISLVLIFTFLFLGLNIENKKYLISKRIPKVIAIILTGISIALSSLIFQTVSNNRILTPSILGLDSLYILIQTFIIYLFSSMSKFIINKNYNFILTVTLMIIFSGLLFKSVLNKNKKDITKLLLIGMILGTLFSSISSFMQMLIDPNEFMHIQDSMYASFNNINKDIIKISSIVLLIIGLITYKNSKILDVMSLGRDEAINLGVDYDKYTKLILFIVSILVSISTALVGPITFLGLLVVNLSREFLESYEHKYLILGSGMLGIIFLLGGQLIVEKIFNFRTPISVIINFTGGIYFIYLLLKENIK